MGSTRDRVPVAKSDAYLATEIANEFYNPSSLFHADLRRKIISALEHARATQIELQTAMDFATEDTCVEMEDDKFTVKEIVDFYNERILYHLKGFSGHD